MLYAKALANSFWFFLKITATILALIVYFSVVLVPGVVNGFFFVYSNEVIERHENPPKAFQKMRRATDLVNNFLSVPIKGLMK